MKVGDIISWSRRFSREEVDRFTVLSGDEGQHHVAEDSAGRVLLHGLLTASMVTRVGGALNFLARTMSFEFLAPVYSGEELVCEVELILIEPSSKGTRLAARCRCINEAGQQVLRGETSGLILEPYASFCQRSAPQLGAMSGGPGS